MEKLLNHFKSSKGFTLIELLIVIAILGVLSAVVLIGINPTEQLAKGRDAGRKTAVGQVGRAAQAYFTDQAVYPTVASFTNSTATNVLVTGGYLQNLPTNDTSTTSAPGCTGGSIVSSKYCYKVDATPATNAVFYTALESKAETTLKCPTAPNTTAWYAYSSKDGRAGTVCTQAGAANEPSAGTNLTFVQ